MKSHLSLLFVRWNKLKSSTCSLIWNQTGVIWYSVKLTFFIGTSLTIVRPWLMDRTLTNPTYCKFVLSIRIKPGKKEKYFIYTPWNKVFPLPHPKKSKPEGTDRNCSKNYNLEKGHTRIISNRLHKVYRKAPTFPIKRNFLHYGQKFNKSRTKNVSFY